MTGNAVLVILVVLPVLALVVVALVNAVSIIPQSTAGVIERSTTVLRTRQRRGMP